MPLYEYQCHRCGKTFEKIQKFSDAPVTVHEGCGGEVAKLISPSALHFKGSGWYVNDYGRNGKSRSDAGNGKTESKTAPVTKSETPEASKPAPTSPGK